MTAPAPAPAPAADARPHTFYDSAAYLFPAGAQYVMAYADGAYKGPADIYKQYPHVHSITVTGHRQALVADYESGNPVHGPLIRTWAEARVTAGGRAVIYSDRADLARLRADLGPMLWADTRILHWIATLDGRQWTAAALAADIAASWGLHIPVGKIWACQWQDTGAWDESILYGTW